MALINKYDGLEIAIIGMSGQFPGSNNCREYWKNLAEGKESIKTFTDEELKNSGVPENLIRNENYVRAMGVLDNKEFFDHGFFGFSTEEASLMDPQIRIFHEHCWKALEDAGYASVIDQKKIALYAGASTNDNWKLYVYTRSHAASLDPFYLNMIKSHNFVNTLVSYKLNLRGGSYFIDTACSTSLSAVHLACRNLLTRESALAIAGGVCVRTNKAKGYLYQEDMIASKDGHCRAFDAAASGTASGEGVGVVVLKRLADAIRDRDHIYAVIKSSWVNNDGNLKVGYTAPSVKGQVECIKMAQSFAKVEAGSIGYIEAHGTGTHLGDPVEVRALNEAFGAGCPPRSCALGSVKTNIGHLDAAAGVAGLIKAALSLKYRQLPASLHYKKANPEIDFAGGPFYVNTELKDWQRQGNMPLRAGVSSLGIGGTNAHVILEEAPSLETTVEGRRYKLLTVSAKTENAVKRYIKELQQFLKDEKQVDAADLAYSLQVGRRAFGYRGCVVYKDTNELADLLEGISVVKSEDRSRSVVFMFPGQGAQYAGMGRELYEEEPLFREQMDKGFALLQQLTGTDHKEILYGSQGDRLIDTRYTQPLLFLFEYSLSCLLMSWGIKPQYMIGHSIGEYVAACISGVFNWEDGLRLVIKRGELMSGVKPGSMLSIALEAADAAQYLEGPVSLAAINGPGQVVVSGETAAIEEIIEKLKSKEIAYTKLHTSHAFHSCMQDGILQAYETEVKKIKLVEPRQAYISNITGELVKEGEVSTPRYWVRHMREPVKFSAGIQTLLLQDNRMVFIEVGPGQSLSGLVRQHAAGYKPVVVNLVPPPREQGQDLAYMVKRLGQLWSHGLIIDWDSFYAGEKRNRIPLPTYSFEQVRYPTEVDPFENGLIINNIIEGIATDATYLQPNGNAGRPDVSSGYVEPKTVTEQKLKKIFEALLGFDQVGAEDNFFELGGDSLKAMLLAKRIRNEWSLNLTVKDLLDKQTIREIALYIDEIGSLLQEKSSPSSKTVII